MKQLLISLKVLLLFTLLTGVLYPLFVTGIAQVFFPKKANGSIITIENKIIGSELIGQQFDSVIYFSSRPSSISYNPLPSGGSNYGLTSYALKRIVDERKQWFVDFNLLDNADVVPSEMLFASASGLDPHISFESACLQIDRISRARNFDERQRQLVEQLIKTMTQRPQLLVLGQERVNVLLLNLELDKIK